MGQSSEKYKSVSKKTRLWRAPAANQSWFKMQYGPESVVRHPNWTILNISYFKSVRSGFLDGPKFPKIQKCLWMRRLWRAPAAYRSWFKMQYGPKSVVRHPNWTILNISYFKSVRLGFLDGQSSEKYKSVCGSGNFGGPLRLIEADLKCSMAQNR